MPNITISVSDELRTEMDELSEVNWSEICRKAISGYIIQRKNPNPPVELELRLATLNYSAIQTGYPTVTLNLKISNRSNSEITVDRILCNAQFREYDTHYGIGYANDLHPRYISPNSSGFSTVHFVLPKEKILELKDAFSGTFYCVIRCLAFIDGFRNPLNQEVQTRIPIDDWKSIVEKVLKPKQAT